MKRSEANRTLVSIVPLEARSEAAGSEKGQQIIPGIVGVVWAITLM